MRADDLQAMGVADLCERYAEAVAEGAVDFRAAVKQEIERREAEDWRETGGDYFWLDQAQAQKAASAQMAELFATGGDTFGPKWKVIETTEFGWPDHSGLSIGRLVARLVSLANEQAAAQGDPPEMERLYWLIDAVDTELDRRGQEGHQALLDLYLHPDLAVRAKAAHLTGQTDRAFSNSRLCAIDDPDWTPLSELALGPLEVQPRVAGEPYERLVVARASVADLVARWTATAERQAGLEFEIEENNRLFFHLIVIEDELRRRGGEAARALMPLLSHREAHVRLKAAYAMIPVDLAVGKAALEEISRSGIAPECHGAGISLRMINEGEWPKGHKLQA